MLRSLRPLRHRSSVRRLAVQAFDCNQECKARLVTQEARHNNLVEQSRRDSDEIKRLRFRVTNLEGVEKDWVSSHNALQRQLVHLQKHYNRNTPFLVLGASITSALFSVIAYDSHKAMKG